MTRRAHPLVAVSAAVLLAAGCSNDVPGDLTESAAKTLQAQVQHVREVAATDDYASLRAAVAELKATVRQQEQTGDVTPSRSNAIQDAADVLLQDARTAMSPSPSPTTESPTPTPTTESPTPTPTTESPTSTPTPTPSETTSPVVSASVGARSSEPTSDSTTKPTSKTTAETTARPSSRARTANPSPDADPSP